MEIIPLRKDLVEIVLILEVSYKSWFYWGNNEIERILIQLLLIDGVWYSWIVEIVDVDERLVVYFWLPLKMKSLMIGEVSVLVVIHFLQ